MVATSDRLLIGLKLLDRVRSGLREGWQASKLLAGSDLVLGISKTTDVKDEALSEEYIWPPSLESMLEHGQELTPFSLLLGVCDDGLPFMLDLKNPSPGSILISGDSGSGKIRLLRSMLTSAAYLSQPDQVRFNVASQSLDEFSTLAQLEHCQELIEPQDSALERLILELADLVEARRSQTNQTLVMIMAIDDLSASQRYLSEQAFARLCWLVRHGPRMCVWTIATLLPEYVDSIHPRLLAAFRTRLLGSIDDRRLTYLLSDDGDLDTRGLEHGYQFYVPYGDDWLPFWVCDPSSDITKDEGLVS